MLKLRGEVSFLSIEISELNFKLKVAEFNNNISLLQTIQFIILRSDKRIPLIKLQCRFHGATDDF